MRIPKIGDIVTYKSSVGKLCKGRVAKINEEKTIVTVVVTEIDGKVFNPTPATCAVENILSVRRPNAARIIDHGTHYSTEPIK